MISPAATTGNGPTSPRKKNVSLKIQTKGNLGVDHIFFTPHSKFRELSHFQNGKSYSNG